VEVEWWIKLILFILAVTMPEGLLIFFGWMIAKKRKKMEKYKMKLREPLIVFGVAAASLSVGLIIGSVIYAIF